MGGWELGLRVVQICKRQTTQVRRISLRPAKLGKLGLRALSKPRKCRALRSATDITIESNEKGTKCN